MNGKAIRIRQRSPETSLSALLYRVSDISSTFTLTQWIEFTKLSHRIR
jgi:hypothetical protein